MSSVSEEEQCQNKRLLVTGVGVTAGVVFIAVAVTGVESGKNSTMLRRTQIFHLSRSRHTTV